ERALLRAQQRAAPQCRFAALWCVCIAITRSVLLGKLVRRLSSTATNAAAVRSLPDRCRSHVAPDQGWRRHGAIDLDEDPGPRPRSHSPPRLTAPPGRFPSRCSGESCRPAEGQACLTVHLGSVIVAALSQDKSGA